MNRDLARCAAEIASLEALPESKFPAYLLAMAEADWRIEAQLIMSAGASTATRPMFDGEAETRRHESAPPATVKQSVESGRNWPRRETQFGTPRRRFDSGPLANHADPS